MSLVQNRQYMCSYGQNTYHLTERGEKSFATLSDPNLNINRYLNAKAHENVGYSFEHLYDDLNVDTREDYLNRHFQPEMRKMDIRRREGYLQHDCNSQHHSSGCNKKRDNPHIFFGVLY